MELYFLAGLGIGLLGFLVWYGLKMRSGARAKAERDIQENTLDDVALGKKARDALADPDERNRVRDKFTRRE